MNTVTFYLHQTKTGCFVYSLKKAYNQKDIDNRLDQLIQEMKVHAKLGVKAANKPSALDLRFLANVKIFIAFGNTMPKKEWQFWDNDTPRYKGMKGKPIAFSRGNLGRRGQFNPKNISTAKADPHCISFMYTGKNGSLRFPLHSEYDLCIKNICKHNGTTFETKIIIDPGSKNNGHNIP